MPVAPPIPRPGSVGLKVFKLVTRTHVALYRASGGRLGRTVKGAPVLLLDHVGRRTGRHRVAPLLYLEDGEDLILGAARAGSDAMPIWWLNLKASPRTTVQVGSEHREVVAREASDAERERLWPLLVEMFGDLAVYQQRTERRIPVIVLSPAGDG